MIRITALSDASPLDSARLKHPLLEFIPCTTVRVRRGPPVVVEVPGYAVDELAPAVREHLEQLLGCELRVEDVPEA